MLKWPSDRACIWGATFILVAICGGLSLAKVKSEFLETTATGFVGASLALARGKKEDDLG